jgi:phospholipid N-methyltransferase
MNLREWVFFARTFRTDALRVASLIPTSQTAARAMSAQVAQDTRPHKAILEVGPGSGAITEALAHAVGPTDQLTLVELNPDFVRYLRQRLHTDRRFAAVRDRVDLLEMSITDLSGEATFDHIVSALPFTNFPPELVEAVLDRYQTLLKPGGSLTFIEYVWGRRARIALSGLTGHRAQKAGAEAVEKLIAARIRSYEWERATVLRNLPPAWIRRWRFSQNNAINIPTPV